MNTTEQVLPRAETSADDAASAPHSAFDRSRRTITTRYISNDELSALDVVTYHDANAKAYRTRVQLVTNHPGAGESYVHDKRRWCSWPVPRYSEKTHVAAASLALLALTPELPALLVAAGIDAEGRR